ncbi:MAG: cyclic nucleotide-binding domain-containing protein [Chloroflexota bacterium]|nr:cyclic nucleotide-binding domain-containing protein [Chloroflexota bacterium]
MDAVSYLREIKIFEKLTPEQLNALAAKAKREHYYMRQQIVRQGELGNRFFIVDTGLVNLLYSDPFGGVHSRGVRPTAPDPDQRKPVKRDFGDQMFTTQEPYEYRAVAIQEADVYVLSRSDFNALAEELPGIIEALDFIKHAERRRTRGFKWVADGEVVALTKRKHWWALVPGLVRTFALILILLVPNALAYIFSPAISQIAIVIQLGLLAVWLAFLVFDWWNDDYIVTSQRVAHVERVFFTQELRESVPIDKVLGVTVDLAFPASVLGVANVIIQTAGREQGNVTFVSVDKPFEIRDLIQKQAERVKARQMADEQESFRTHINQALRERLMPQTIAKEPETEEQPPDRRQRRQTLGQAFRRLVRAALPFEEHLPNQTIWRKHWIVFLRQTWKWWLVLVGLDVLFAILAINSDRLMSVWQGIMFGGGVLFLIALGRLLWEWEDWRNDTYAVTESQIIDAERMPFGFKEKHTVASLDQVQDVRVEVPDLLASVLNYGDVKIETAGKSGQMIFYSIHNPRGAQDEIFHRLRAYQLNRAEREAAIRSRSVVDALIEYDHLKVVEQQQPAAPASSSAAPNGPESGDQTAPPTDGTSKSGTENPTQIG